MNKKLIKLILVVIIVIGLSACSNNKVIDDVEKENTNNGNLVGEENNTEEDNTLDLDIEFSDVKVELEEGSKLKQMFYKLNEYGKEIYDRKEYVNYKIKNNMYFISLNGLAVKYDVSMFVGEDGTVCDKNNSGIYFNIDKKVNSENLNKLDIIPVLIGCSQEEIIE